MSSIVEVSESGTLQLPAEILQAIQLNTRFVVEVESDRQLAPSSVGCGVWGVGYGETRE